MTALQDITGWPKESPPKEHYGLAKGKPTKRTPKEHLAGAVAAAGLDLVLLQVREIGFGILAGLVGGPRRLRGEEGGTGST